MSAQVTLTEAEREALSASIDRDDLPGLYGSMIAAVEQVVAARMAQAWDEGCTSGTWRSDVQITNPYREKGENDE